MLTAKAKGVSQRGILFGHVLKNCLLPVITLAGMRFSSLVTGSFIVESVFGLARHGYPWACRPSTISTTP